MKLMIVKTLAATAALSFNAWLADALVADTSTMRVARDTQVVYLGPGREAAAWGWLLPGEEWSVLATAGLAIPPVDAIEPAAPVAATITIRADDGARNRGPQLASLSTGDNSHGT